MVKTQLLELPLETATPLQELCRGQVINGSHAVLNIWQLHLLHCCTSLANQAAKITILQLIPCNKISTQSLGKRGRLAQDCRSTDMSHCSR